MASLAIGATLRLETDGPPEGKSVQDFQCQLAGPLGLVGDTLFWGTLKPNAALLALFIGFLLYGDSLAPLIAAIGFLFVFNILHLWIRWWGLKTGWRLGDRVLSALGKSPITTLKTWLPIEGAVLLGLVAGAVLRIGASQSWYAVAAVMAGGLWAWVGTQLRLSVPIVTAIPLIMLLIVGAFS